MSRREHRVQLQSSLIAGPGLGSPAQSPVGFAKITVIKRLHAIHGDGLADAGDGRLMLTGLVSDEPQQVQGVGMSRIPPQDLAIELLGLRQLARLVKVHRRLKRVRTGRHVQRHEP